MILIAASAFAQEQPLGGAYSCHNQTEVELIGYERIRGPVESLNVEVETLVSEGDVIFTNKGKPYLFANYRYDARGRLIEKNFYRLDGQPLPKSTFDYDEYGRLVRENYFSAVSNKAYLETSYVYKNGLLFESVGRNIEQASFLSKTVYTYDQPKRYFEFVESYSYNSPPLRIGIKQDEKCRFVEVLGFDRDGKISVRTVFAFDQYDNPVSGTTYSTGANVLGKIKYEYEFDVSGNWIKRSRFRSELDDKDHWTLVEISYRKIRYSSPK